MSKRNKIIVLVVGIAIVAFSLTFTGVFLVNKWFESHRLLFHSPVEVKVFQPIRVQERKPEIRVINNIISYPGEVDTPIKKYICDKFGPYDCKIALAIVDAESGFNDQAIHVNDNGTVDLGCWQINSIHYKAKTITPIDALDCKKATDWAYDKVKRDGGWGAWVTFTTGAFKNHI